jgi:isopentenyldiphosphate isomerase
MTETIDIYDANLVPLGVMERGEAHRSAQWHQTFHCWVVTGPTQELPSGGLLFQGRSTTATNYPGMLDVSAAGHLIAGETIMDGLREVREELGISLDASATIPLGRRVEVADQANGQKNREYQSVFLARIDRPLSDYRPDPGEVASLYWLGIDEGLSLFGDSTSSATRLLGYSYENTQSQWLPSERMAVVGDFLPRIQQYYLTVLIMAERLLQGMKYLAIS